MNPNPNPNLNEAIATAPGARLELDSASWERGRLDALERKRHPSQPVACSLSWSSGWIEGDAERRQQQQQR